jgi:hypothetical protein
MAIEFFFLLLIFHVMDSADDDIRDIPLEDQEEEETPRKSKSKRKSRRETPRKKRKGNDGESIPNDEEDVHEPFAMDIGVSNAPSLEGLTPEQLYLRSTTINNLKAKLTQHPGLDITDLVKLDNMLHKMSTEELVSYYENIKIRLGLTKPGETARNFLGLASTTAARYFNKPELIADLMGDDDLVTSIDHYIGNDSYIAMMSGPMHIMYKIVKAVTK